MKFRYYFFASLLLFILPLVFIYTGYNWDLQNLANVPFWAKLVNLPDIIFLLATCAVLTLVILFFYRKNLRLALSIIIYAALAIGGTQVIKDVAKNYIAEPRPFLATVTQRLADADPPSYFIDMQDAYNILHQDNKTPEALLCKECKTADDIQDMYYKLNKEEKIFFIDYFGGKFMAADSEKNKRANLNDLAVKGSYSLPSGHATFVATWMFIFLLLAFNAHSWSFWLVTLGVLTYGHLVEASRIVLGLHYPHDILAGDILATAFVWLTFWLVFVFYRLLGGYKRSVKTSPSDSASSPKAPATNRTSMVHTEGQVNNDLDTLDDLEGLAATSYREQSAEVIKNPHREDRRV